MGLKKRGLRVVGELTAGIAVLLLLVGWGQTGHKIINGGAIRFLPPSMGRFIQQANFITQHAADPDGWKGSDSKKAYYLKEGPRHFIDIDSYSEFTTRTVPEDISILIAKYDSSNVFSIGVNPWACIWVLDSLTDQLKQGDWQHVLQTAADLGHYIGDATQPLHNTQDYDGRATAPGSDGIHSRYETTMVTAYQGELVIHPDSVHYVSNPIDFVFGIVYQSNSYVDSIYAADANARQTTGWSGSGSIPSTYTAALWEKTGGFTKLQIQRASQNYADLLYTAWVNAGSPDLTGIPASTVSHLAPRDLQLDQNFPNPFNPTTTIGYHVPYNAHVDLAVYSLQGTLIATLVNQNLARGDYRAAFDAGLLSLSSGIYVYRLKISSAGSAFSTSRKLVLLK